jgi:hypothetical protein
MELDFELLDVFEIMDQGIIMGEDEGEGCTGRLTSDRKNIFG